MLSQKFRDDIVLDISLSGTSSIQACFHSTADRSSALRLYRATSRELRLIAIKSETSESTGIGTRGFSVSPSHNPDFESIQFVHFRDMGRSIVH